MASIIKYENFTDHDYIPMKKLISYLPKNYQVRFRVLLSCTKKFPFIVPNDVYCKILKLLCYKKTIVKGFTFESLKSLHQYITTPEYQLVDPIFMINKNHDNFGLSLYSNPEYNFLKWYYSDNEDVERLSKMVFRLEYRCNWSKDKNKYAARISETSLFLGVVGNKNIKDIKLIHYDTQHNNHASQYNSDYQIIKLNNIYTVNKYTSSKFFNVDTYDWYKVNDIYKTEKPTSLELYYFNILKNYNTWCTYINIESDNPIDSVELLYCTIPDEYCSDYWSLSKANQVVKEAIINDDEIN